MSPAPHVYRLTSSFHAFRQAVKRKAGLIEQAHEAELRTRLKEESVIMYARTYTYIPSEPHNASH